MITDNQLYSLAIFLGSLAMLLIVLYHFLEVNNQDNDAIVVNADAAGKLAKGEKGEKAQAKMLR
jgi:oligosaccharyl transferase complex subunit OST4